MLKIGIILKSRKKIQNLILNYKDYLVTNGKIIFLWKIIRNYLVKIWEEKYQTKIMILWWKILEIFLICASLKETLIFLKYIALKIYDILLLE